MKNKKLFLQLFLFSLLLFGTSWVWIFSSEHCLSLGVIWLFSVKNVTKMWQTYVSHPYKIIF